MYHVIRYRATAVQHFPFSSLFAQYFTYPFGLVGTTQPASEEEDDSGDEGGAGSAFRDEAFETTEEGGDLEGEQEAVRERDKGVVEIDRYGV